MMHKMLDDVPEYLKTRILNANGVYSAYEAEAYPQECTLEEFSRALDLMRGFPDEWPEGVEYWAQDGDGWWYPFMDQPNQYKEESWNGGGLRGGVKGTLIGDWRTTLRKRPESSGNTGELKGETVGQLIRDSMGDSGKSSNKITSQESVDVSMAKCVAMFNTLYGDTLTEDQGTVFLQLFDLAKSSK